MADLLINLSKEVNRDPATDAKRLHYGDVVCIVEDGHQWNANETSGQFMVVKMPSVKIDDVGAFMVPQVGDSLKNPLLLRRAFKFDVDAYVASVQDPSAKTPDQKQKLLPKPDLTLTDALSLKVANAVVANPDVLGTDPNVLG